MNFAKKIIENHNLNTKIALNFKDDNHWNGLTWREFTEKIAQLSHALKSLGVQPKDKVAIYSENTPEWIIMHFAILNMGAITVPIFATLTSDQVNYIVKDSNAKIILVGAEKQYNVLLEAMIDSYCPINQIIVAKKSIQIKSNNTVYFYDLIKNFPIEYNVYNNNINDIATIIYTSGTTGEPKGVMLSHGNFIGACKAHIQFFNMYPSNENTLVFLPLSHVFELCWSSFVLSCGGKLSFCENPREVMQYLVEVKPTAMCAVPRLFQKIYNVLNEKIESSPKTVQSFFKWALKTGKEFANYKRIGKTPPLSLSLKYKIADIFAFKKVKKQLGGNLHFIPVGGAAIPSIIPEFFDAIGIHLTVGYGLTETTATVAAYPLKNYIYNSVGKPMTGVNIKIGENNEILVKGYGIFKGYYNKEKATQETFTEDGWFKTGDAGEIDNKGNLIIIDRIKDLMKTSNGKYVSPQPIESLLINDPYIQQAVLIGDNRPFVSALIVPNFETLKKKALELNLGEKSIKELVEIEEILIFYKNKISAIQEHLAPFEQVKKFQLLSQDFDMNKGEVTPTIKVRRKIVIEKYSNLIEKMYEK